jgi:surface antigen
MVLPLIALFAYTNVPALASAAASLFIAPKIVNDAYDYGNCTYWVALRRLQTNQPIPNDWGNAISWAANAAKDGYLVNHIPATGAIMQDPNALGGEGHVAFVESVNAANGSWQISEMNRIGWDEVDYRTLSAAAALKYNFIH